MTKEQLIEYALQLTSTRYDTNKTIRAYIDRRLKTINEKYLPLLECLDPDPTVKKEIRKLQKEIKLKDPLYYELYVKGK